MSDLSLLGLLLESVDLDESHVLYLVLLDDLVGLRLLEKGASVSMGLLPDDSLEFIQDGLIVAGHVLSEPPPIPL